MTAFMGSPTFDPALYETLKQYLMKKIDSEITPTHILKNPCHLYLHIDNLLHLYTNYILVNINTIIKDNNFNSNSPQVNTLVQKIEALRTIHSIPVQGGVIYPLAYLFDSRLKDTLTSETSNTEYYTKLLEIMNKIQPPYYLMNLARCKNIYDMNYKSKHASYGSILPTHISSTGRFVHTPGRKLTKYGSIGHLYGVYNEFVDTGKIKLLKNRYNVW
jgi:hypothetical protein